MTLAEAVAAGLDPRRRGVANRGGVIAPARLSILGGQWAQARLASGLHNLLRDRPDLLSIAMARGASCTTCGCPGQVSDRQWREAPRQAPPRGRHRCSIGKMYTALAMDREMRERGRKSTFRATGQTGILITGDGVPLDAVIADFMARQHRDG